jgi:transposase
VYVSRERTTLVAERTRLVNQLRSWLATWGAVLPRHRREGWWTTVRDWAGAALPAEVQARIARAEARLARLATQVATVEATQQAAVRTAPAARALARLVRLRGVGTTSASTLVAEGLVWRQFTNRRQVGGCLGFTPTPYQSGAAAHDQGISGAGNRRLQATCIQLAWTWIRWQPFSPLTQWYRRRFGQGTRPRRIGIVAVARRLLIALWRYVSTGVVPEAALLQAA